MVRKFILKIYIKKLKKTRPDLFYGAFSGTKGSNSTLVDEYLRKLRRVRPDLFDGDSLKDTKAQDRLRNVKLEYRNDIITAVTILEDNKIIIGFNAQNEEILLFHELEHVRKGVADSGLYPNEASYVRWNGDKISLFTKDGTEFSSVKGVFFDEAITEFIAQCIFKNKSKDEITCNFKPARERYSDKVKTLVEYARALDMNPVDLCAAIENRRYHHDFSIDKLSRQKNLDFELIERALDCSGTLVMRQTQCENKMISKQEENGQTIYAKGCDEESIEFVQRKVRMVKRMFAEARKHPSKSLGE